jgi:hypothetical protein
VDTIQDNPAIVAAIAGGLLLFFVILIVIAVLLGRRKRQPEQAWEPEQDAYAPSLYQYDTVSEPGGVQPSVPSSPTEGAGMVGGTEVAPAEQPVGTAPDIGFQPPPPMPGQQPPPPQAPPASADGTMIIERGPKMAYQAILIERQRPENRYDITKPSVNLGRASTNDIAVDNATISRQHAIIKLDQDVFRIYDLGSSNGTFVNDQQVIEPIVLQDGAIVRLGDMAFIFKVISLEG